MNNKVSTVLYIYICVGVCVYFPLDLVENLIKLEMAL